VGFWHTLHEKHVQAAFEGVYARRKAKLVSFKSYYLRILAGGKPGFPTREEAQQDFRAMLADSMPIRYG
jgi:hypothetical protein